MENVLFTMLTIRNFSLLEGVSYGIESSSTQELAIAYEQMNKMDDAHDAWLRYAGLEIERTNNVEAGSDGFVRAVSLIASQGDAAGICSCVSTIA